VVEVIDGRAYHRAVRILGRPCLLRVSEDIAEPTALRVEIAGDRLTEAHLTAAADLTRRVFATDIDPARIAADVADDAVFAAVARRFLGLRPVLIADPFETLVWAIIGQQINVGFAAKLKRALVESFGEQVQDGDRAYRLFPRAEVLAALDHSRDLRPLQFSRQKSEYTIGVARAVAAGDLDLEALRSLEAEEAIARLTALKGVGRWTAEYTLMRGLGFRDVLPAGDGGLRRIIGREYGLGRLASEAEVRRIGAGWAPWRSYAAFYWWFTLQLEARGEA
jgi:DNA-3-methyladenine glycosylase II